MIRNIVGALLFLSVATMIGCGEIDDKNSSKCYQILNSDYQLISVISCDLNEKGIYECYKQNNIGSAPRFHSISQAVQLSSFYAKRNDNNHVTITWATESELDNAGFNLSRSTSRTGEFTRINAQLIPGAGTTGERYTYTWTDTGANPDVLYYYQIEDVSLDGVHRTLRTTRLRGYVGAHGKLSTTWGDLKSRE